MLWGIPGDVAIFAIAVVAFFAVGLLFVTKAFVWCFLLTYALLRLVGPTGIGATFGLSLWTGVVSDWAAKRRQNKQKLVEASVTRNQIDNETGSPGARARRRVPPG